MADLKTDIFNKEGKKVGEISLEPKIFNVDPKLSLIKEAVVVQLANRRQVLAHAKTRAEVRGGGRKPWRQKGTGRARHGSIRSPIWRGGGITFGPTKEKNYKKKINKKAKRKALFMALTDKLRNKKLVVVEDLSLNKAKTKEFVKLIKKLPLGKSFLCVLPKTDLNIIRASNNLKEAKCIRADSLNVYDVVRFENLVIPKESLKVISETYL